MTTEALAQPGIAPTEKPPCPYVGLDPFGAGDREYFFGRDRDIDLIVANVEAFRLTLLYGPSGVGKSSVLGAGVVPKLAERSEGRPALVIALNSWRDDVSRALDVETWQAATAAGLTLPPTDPAAPLAERLQTWAEHIRGDVFCVFDQFEDYFLYHDKPGERFGVELARALASEGNPANFLISLREDALGQLDRFQPYVPNLFDNYYRLDHLRSDQAREAIVGPVARYNSHRSGPPVEIESALVEDVLAQVRTGEVVVGATGEGRLARAAERDEIETAHLQLVLTRLWEEDIAGGSSVLRAETLVRLGGAAAIVRAHLDDSMAHLPHDAQTLAERVFGQLVTPSGTKIAHTADDLASYAEVGTEELTPVLDYLADGNVRILRGVPPAPSRPDSPRYEIFHDALAPAILDWRHRQVAAEQRADAERQLAASRSSLRRERRRRLRLAGVLVLSLVLLAATGVLLYQSRAAERRQRSERLAAESAEMIEADPTEAARLAVLAWDGDDTDAAADAIRVASSRLLAQRALVGHTAAISSVDVSADGDLTLTTSHDGTSRVWDSGGSPVATLVGHDGPVYGGQFSPDGASILTWSVDGTARSWNAETGTPLAVVDDYDAAGARAADVSADGRLAASPNTAGGVTVWEVANGDVEADLPPPAGSAVTALTFNPADADILFTGHEDGAIRAWSVSAPTEARASVQDPRMFWISAMAVSPDGKTVAAGTGIADLLLWEWSGDEEPVVTFADEHGTEPIVSISFSADGKALVGAARKASVLWRDDGNGWQAAGALEHTDWANSVDIADDFFVSASRDGTVLAGDSRTGQLLADLRGHAGAVMDIVVTPDGAIVTASDDGTARVWRAPTARSLVGHRDWVIDVDVAADDGRTAASAGTDGQVIVWDTNTGAALETIDGIADHEFYSEGLPEMQNVAITGDGNLVVASSRFGDVWLWDLGTGIERPVREWAAFATGLDFEPDGSRLAIATDTGQIQLWDLDDDNANPAATIATGGRWAFIDWSPDGRRIAAGLADGSVAVFDAESLERTHTLRGHRGQVWAVAFSPDSASLATAGQDRTARIWDLASGEERARLAGHDVRLAAIAYLPGGEDDADDDRVVTGDAAGWLGIWDAATGQPLSLARAHGDSLNGLAILEGEAILSAGDDQALRVQSCEVCVPVDELVDRLRERLDALPPAEDLPAAEEASWNAAGRGSCISEYTVGAPAATFDVVDCAEPHQAEVAATFALPGGPFAPYPELDDLATRVDATCDEAFEEYVGIAPSESRFGIYNLVPSEKGWNLSDRSVVCLVLSPDASTIGSARGAGG